MNLSAQSKSTWWGFGNGCSTRCGPSLPLSVTRSHKGSMPPSARIGNTASEDVTWLATTMKRLSASTHRCTGFLPPVESWLTKESVPPRGSMRKALISLRSPCTA
jgi:hypothetical protein